MTYAIHRRAAATLSLIAVTGLAGCGTSSGMSGMDHGSSGSSSAPAATTSATPAAGPHNDADVMFATMMIPHHQQAVVLSDVILGKDGIDPQVRALAEQIKAAQAPEIVQMGGWLAGWGRNPTASGMDHGMDHSRGETGMMSQADLDALRAAEGPDASKRFLTGMIAHHRGAVTMAEQEVAGGRNPDAVTLAKGVITSQSAEITTMSALLQKL